MDRVDEVVRGRLAHGCRQAFDEPEVSRDLGNSEGSQRATIGVNKAFAISPAGGRILVGRRTARCLVLILGSAHRGVLLLTGRQSDDDGRVYHRGWSSNRPAAKHGRLVEPPPVFRKPTPSRSPATRPTPRLTKQPTGDPPFQSSSAANHLRAGRLKRRVIAIAPTNVATTFQTKSSALPGSFIADVTS